ncbi:HAMP domain-containing sensor histidine kinase [Novosphingobium sp. BL-8H]|uniref:sensor histidine kinase n=1 Tax=Novosphingobium sp. BL-8H TaxID=3127640 RepID=UPI003757A280
MSRVIAAKAIRGHVVTVVSSIRGRLLVVGVVLTGAALLAAALSIDVVLDSYVRRSLDRSLDVQIGLLARSVRPDGTVDGAMLHQIAPYTQYRRGWTWRIEARGQVYGATDQIGVLDFHPYGTPGREGHFKGPPETLQSGRSGDLYVRLLVLERPSGTVRITAVAPHAVYKRLRAAAVAPVLVTLGLLCLALLGASLLQLHVGLKPLQRLKQAIEGVRAGRLHRVPDRQPAELQSLAAELNAMLDENEAALSRARGHVSNLAHSLKTPLATLSVKLGQPGRDPDGQLGELVAQIDGAIRHHLGRARAASPGAPGRRVVSVTEPIGDLLDALARVYPDRRITAEARIAADLSMKCDPQDLSEMLGNLLDNAFKWASTRIVVSGAEDGKFTRITIEDDGPGIGSAVIEQAMVPGKRLDEREDGHGFGLPIARELAELHGGSLGLGPSELGGLRVTLMLPR